MVCVGPPPPPVLRLLPPLPKFGFACGLKLVHHAVGHRKALEQGAPAAGLALGRARSQVGCAGRAQGHPEVAPAVARPLVAVFDDKDNAAREWGWV